MSFKEELDGVLTADSVDGKVLQLVGLVGGFAEAPTSNDFNWKSALDEDRIGYFNEMIAEALNSYFGIESSSDDVDAMSTPQELIDFINSRS